VFTGKEVEEGHDVVLEIVRVLKKWRVKKNEFTTLTRKTKLEPN